MRTTRTQRWWALLALLMFALTVALLLRAAMLSLPRGIIEVLLLLAAAVVTWYALVNRGVLRSLYGSAAVLLVIAAMLTPDGHEARLVGFAAIGTLALCAVATRAALRPHVRLTPAIPPTNAVVVWNPRSGGGKAAAVRLDDEARRRGIRPIELTPGSDLRDLVRDAVAQGADGLMAAGGDGTQAIIAAMAAELDLPFACIPAGTRNHFALDLGVDRDDVVGALDAFVNGGEKRVDLAEVNGRVFVNNVSLGIYAEAVQRPGYRESKIRSLLVTAPEVLAEDSGSATPFTWAGPDGQPQTSAAVVLVSNNAYRLGLRLAAGTRPRMDAGVLGVTVVGAMSGGSRTLANDWTSPTFEVRADSPVPAGVDGEALTLDSPVTFRSRPGALRVRIAPQHPGASPSATLPAHPWGLVPALWRVATGRRPTTWPT